MGPKPTPIKRGPLSNRKANAAGFAKRQSRKTEAASRMNSDVYEYSSGKNKRSAITLSLDKDEEIGLGEY
jgi:U3 small nucleolar RNA-associated protein 14